MTHVLTYLECAKKLGYEIHHDNFLDSFVYDWDVPVENEEAREQILDELATIEDVEVRVVGWLSDHGCSVIKSLKGEWDVAYFREGIDAFDDAATDEYCFLIRVWLQDVIGFAIESGMTAQEVFNYIPNNRRFAIAPANLSRL